MLLTFLALHLNVLLLFMATLQQTKTVICEEQTVTEEISTTCYLMENGIMWCSHSKDDTIKESVTFLEVGVSASDICETFITFLKNPTEYKDKFQLKCKAECTKRNQRKLCSCQEYVYESLASAFQYAPFKDESDSKQCPDVNWPKPIDFLFFNSKESADDAPHEQTLFARTPTSKVKQSRTKNHVRSLLASMGFCRGTYRNTRSQESRGQSSRQPQASSSRSQQPRREEEEDDPYKDFPSLPNTPIKYPVENVGSLRKTKTWPRDRETGQSSTSQKRREEEEPDLFADFPPIPGTLIPYPEENIRGVKRTKTWPKQRESSSGQQSREEEETNPFADFPPVPGSFIENPHGGNGHLRKTRPPGKTDPYADFPPVPGSFIENPHGDNGNLRKTRPPGKTDPYADFPPIPAGIEYPPVPAPSASFQRSRSGKNIGQSSTSQSQQKGKEGERDPKKNGSDSRKRGSPST